LRTALSRASSSSTIRSHRPIGEDDGVGRNAGHRQGVALKTPPWELIAHSAVEAGLALNPAFSISRARAAWSAMSDDPTYLALLERQIEGMRKAGVPEQ
jgi:hypothetical protein